MPQNATKGYSPECRAIYLPGKGMSSIPEPPVLAPIAEYPGMTSEQVVQA